MTFCITKSNDLDAIELSKRSAITNPNEIVLIECTSFPSKSLARGCHMSRVCFQTTRNGPWKMGIVPSMVYYVESQSERNTQGYVPGVLHVYEWVGRVVMSDSGFVPFVYF